MPTKTHRQKKLKGQMASQNSWLKCAALEIGKQAMGRETKILWPSDTKSREWPVMPRSVARRGEATVARLCAEGVCATTPNDGSKTRLFHRHSQRGPRDGAKLHLRCSSRQEHQRTVSIGRHKTALLCYLFPSSPSEYLSVASKIGALRALGRIRVIGRSPYRFSRPATVPPAGCPRVWTSSVARNRQRMR